MKNILSSIFYTLITFLFIVNSSASETLSYSGRLVNPNGSPVVGPVNLKVELAYSNSPTVIRCSQNFTNIILSNGVFHLNVNFDCGSPVTLSQVLTQIPANESAAIRVTNITDLANPKVYSFQALHSMPFANIAETSKQLVQMEATDGQVLKWDNATARWKPGAAGGGGTVTSVSGTLPISVAIGSSTPVISMSVANTSTSGYLSSADWNSFNSKEGTIAGGSALQYYRGDKSWQTLNTSVVPESGVTNLYFSNARVLGVPLDGFVAGPGVIAATDTVLQAFAKTQGQINSLTTDSAKYLIKNSTDSITGVVTVASPTGFLRLIDPPAIFTDATNMAYVDSRDDLKVSKAGDTMSGVLTLDNDLKIKGGANYVTLKGHATSATYNLFLPQNAGTSGFVLSTDGSGNTTWINPASVANGSDTVTSASIVDGSIVDADINASAAIAQSKIANLSTDLAGKEPTVTNPNDTSKYYRGDKSWQTLNTTAVAEGSKLYFSNARVLGADLLGLNTGVAGPITVVDTVLGAFGKLQYQVTDLKAKGQWEKNVNDIYYNAGNVGIGMTSPNARLSIQEDGTLPGLELVYGGSNSYATIRGPLNRVLRVDIPGNDTSDGFLIRGSQDAGSSYPNNVLFARADGNVGIGTTTPIAKLHINHPMNNGASKYSWQSGTGLLINNPSFADGGEVAKIVLNTASGGYNSGAIIHVEGAGSYNAGQLVFSTGWDAAGNGTERLRIKNDGKVGIGTATPRSKLEVLGGIQIGADAVTCDATKVGTLRYNAGNVEYCNGGPSWQAFGISGGGITNINGSTNGTQSFANASTGTTPAWSTAAGVHTLNIPLASGAGVTAGLISKTQYDTFNGKLGTTLNSGNILVGNGSNVATAVAMSGDATLANTGAVTLKNTGTAGTYSSVTTDAQGRVTTGSNPVVVASITGTAPVTIGGTASAPVVSMAAAATAVNGYLTSTDWNTFNSKQAALLTGPTINGIIYPANAAQTLQIPLAPVSLTDAVNKQYVDSFGQWGTSAGNVYRSSGNVGIGTTSPSSKLEISGGESADESRLEFSASDNSNRFTIETDLDGTTGNDLLGFRSAGTDNILVLKGNGNVGIGTTTPQAKLHVVGGGIEVDNSNPIYSYGLGMDSLSVDSKYTMFYTSSTNGALFLTGGKGTFANSQNDINFGKWDGTSLTKLMTILSASGNVGIGTSSPPHKLTVQGNQLITTNDYVHGSVGSALWLARGAATGNTHSIIQAYHDGAMTYAPLAVNPNGGNVGIGIATPSSLLHVNGSIRAQELCDLTGGNCKSIASGWGNVSAANMIANWPDAIVCDNGTDKSVMYHDTSAGNLEYYGKSSGPHWIRFNATTGAFYDLTAGMAGSSICSGKSISTLVAEGRTFGLLGGGVDWTTNGTDVYRSGGKVGIGTTTPVAKLNVVGAPVALPASTGTVQTGSNLRLKNSDSALVLDIGSNGAFGAWLQASADTNLANTYPLLLNPNGGNVGIGTALPLSKLHVESNNPLRLTRDVTGTKYGIDTTIDASRIIFNGVGPAPSSNILVLRHDNGNIGIGTATPAQALDVIGNIKTSACLYYASSSLGTCASDERIKKDVHSFDLGLDALQGINPVKFKYNGLAGFEDDGKEHLGVIAQEIEKAAPELIKTQKVQLHKNDQNKTEIKVVDYGAFTYVIINSIKELYNQWFDDSKEIHRELASVKNENAELKKENEVIKARLEHIEKVLAPK